MRNSAFFTRDINKAACSIPFVYRPLHLFIASSALFFGLGIPGLIHAASAGDPAGWRITFDTLPKDWAVQGKPFTPEAVFEIAADPTNSTQHWLSMTADKASASLKSSEALPVDLKKTPIMRWCWRATVLPTGADGRDPKKDDQAIGLYISSGGMFKQQSLAYRWETETPTGAEGDAQYAKVVSVHWMALRNKQDADGQTFYTEERNVADDYQKAFGSIPEKIGVGISCNSQYTASKAAAQLQWIEFVPAITNR